MKAPFNNHIRRTYRGASTLELLIAFAILALTMTAAIQVVLGNQVTGTDSQTAIEALGKSEALIEAARATSRQDFSAVVSSGPTNDSVYTKQVTVSYPNVNDSDTKLVVAQVSWWDGLRPISVKLSTIVTNSSSGAFCSATLSDPTGWKDPTPYEIQSTDLVQASPIGSSANGMGLGGMYVYRGKMYLTLNSTPGSDSHTFYIYSLASNPATTPTFQGWSYNPSISGDQLADVRVAPRNSSLYAYVLSAKSFNFSSAACTNTPTSCAQIQVVDVTTPTAPVWKTGLMMPVTGSGGQGIGTALAYDKGYVYVGLAKGAGSSDTEFNIIDVGGGSASPTSPSRVGGYHVGFTVKSIAIDGNYAYLATTDTTSGNKQIIVLTISSKSNPQYVTSFNAPDNFGVGNAVVVSNSKAYFGKAFSSTYPNFYILDASSPGSGLSTLGSKIAGTNDSVNSLAVRDHYAFLVTNKQFQIWDVSNPGSLVPWTTDGTTASFLSFSSIDSKIGGFAASSCSGDLLYGAFQSSTGTHKDMVVIFGPHVTSSYSLSTSGAISLQQGDTGGVAVTAAVVSGYPGSTNFSVSGLPSGATGTFSLGSCTPGCSTTLTIATSLSTPAGTYPITVTGSSGAVTTSFNLTVTTAPFVYTLSNSGNITTTQGAAGNTSITRTLTSGAPQAVSIASVSGLPSGASYSVTNNPCTPSPTSCSSTLTITTSAATPIASSPITVTDNNGKTTTFTLTVNAAVFDYTVSAPNASVAKKGSVVETITLTKASGPSQNVTITLSNLPSGISLTQSSLSCTPLSTTCALNFTINATASGKSGTITVTGAPTGTHTPTTFTLTVN